MGKAGTAPMPPSMIDELKYVGVNAVYGANNHMADFGKGGILLRSGCLREKGLVKARYW